MTEYANYVITAIGLIGFYLAGKKVWWCWYVNIANQVLWFSYGVATEQWGFVLGTFFYTAVFVRNAVVWTLEHFSKTDLDEPEWSMRNVIFVNQVVHQYPRAYSPNPEGGPIEIRGEVSLHNEVDRDLVNAHLWVISKPTDEWVEEFNKRTSRDRWISR